MKLPNYTQQTKGAIPESNYTMFPNIVIDDYMRDLSGSAFKVLAAIVRSTIGWHKTRGRISQSQIGEITGLVRKSVKYALQELIDKELITESATHTNKEAKLYDLNIRVGEGEIVPIEEQNCSTVEYTKLPLQRGKKYPSRGVKITPTKEKKESKQREEPAKPSLPSSQSPQGKTLPSNNGSGSDSAKRGRRCTDPVIRAFIAEHVSLFHFEPLINFAAAGARLKQLRKQFSDEQLIALIRAAKKDERAWYRTDKGKPTYDLLVLLSSSALNAIRRAHPDVFSPKVEKRIKCPACGNEWIGSSTACLICDLSLTEFGDPAAIREHQILAMIWGRLPVCTEADRKAVADYNRKCGRVHLADEGWKKSQKEPGRVNHVA